VKKTLVAELSGNCSDIRIDALEHPHCGDRETAGKWMLVTLRHGVAERGVKRLACKRGDENRVAGASGADSRLAGGKNGATNATSRPIGMNEEDFMAW
jgi:hypothetical protein